MMNENMEYGAYVSVKLEYLSDTEQAAEDILSLSFEKPEPALVAAVKCEDITFECTTCFMQFTNEDAYSEHIHLQLEGECGTNACQSQSHPPPLRTNTQAPHTASRGSSLRTGHSRSSQNPHEDGSHTEVTRSPASSATNNERKVYRSRKAVSKQNASLKIAQETISSGNWNSQNKDTDSKHLNVPTTSSSAVITIETECADNDNIKSKDLAVNSLHTNLGRNDLNECFICDFCQKTFKRKALLFRHIRIHTGAKPFACNFCDYKCSLSGNLAKHRRTHTGEKPYACSLCDYKCSVRVSLNNHMRTHTGEKPFACCLCDYKCSQLGSLTNHMRTHTFKKTLVCSLCNNKFSASNSLSKHMKTHPGEISFSCSLCGYKGIHKYNLTYHMRTHSDEKPFTCSVCDYSCLHRGHLTRHMLIHTDEKPYSCKLCDYKCRLKCNLTIHMRTHTGEKPFKCSICHHKFTQKISLITHMRTHTGEKPFACTLCDYKCSVRSNLNQHMRTHTGKLSSFKQ